MGAVVGSALLLLLLRSQGLEQAQVETKPRLHPFSDGGGEPEVVAHELARFGDEPRVEW